MQKDIFLSVVMPVYNAENYIRDTLKSLLSQTFSDFEVICVNDCSKDSTAAILDEIASNDPRVKCVHLSENKGAGAARNEGIERATGKYITFMDSDDIIDPDLYEKAVLKTENGSIDEVVWGLTEEHYNKKGKFVRSVPISIEERLADNAESIMQTVVELEKNTLFGYQWNSFYKASIIKENNIRFEDSLFYEDYFFNLDFAKKMQSIAVLNHNGYHYFKRVNGSITNRFSKDYYDLSYRRIESMLDFCEDRGYLNKEVYSVLGNRFLRYTLSALSRNNNPSAEMDSKKRKEWVKNAFKRPLYQRLFPNFSPEGITFKILYNSLKKEWFSLVCLLGRIVYFLR